MQSFKDYSKNGSGINGNVNGDVMSILKDLASKYEGADQNTVISAILKEAEKGRKNGTLTNADLDNFYNAVSPMLNGRQRETLSAVISKIKGKG